MYCFTSLWILWYNVPFNRLALLGRCYFAT